MHIQVFWEPLLLNKGPSGSLAKRFLCALFNQDAWLEDHVVSTSTKNLMLGFYLDPYLYLGTLC